MNGTRSSRWLVLDYGHIKTPKNTYLNCKCDCGTIRLVRKLCFTSGQSQSCGCRTKEINKRLNTSHGLYYSPLYMIWRNMHGRCYDPENKRYKRYGARGIIVCERWHDLALFVADNQSMYKPGLTLDRKNNDGQYSPDNCRWATRIEQANNKSTNRLITYKGKTQNISQWADELSIPRSCLYLRISRRGWPVEKALTTPVGSR